MSQSNPLDHARPLDVWIWSNKPEIKAASNYIFSLLQKKQRLDKKIKLGRLKNHLKVILTDLFVAHREDPHLYLAFSRDMARYVACKRYRKIFLHPQLVALVTDFLAAEGYIEFHKGIRYATYARMSRMRATPKLLRYFRRYRSDEGIFLNRRPEIILRDAEKKELDINFDHIQTKILFRNVRKINAFLSKHAVTLDLASIPGDISELENIYFSERNTKYVRIFNNGDFGQGGRFYCHWSQMIPKEFRRYIQIDGQETIELDYSCLHISMLYGLVGKIPPEGDLYALNGISTEFRPVVKKAFNIAINSADESTALMAIREEIRHHERRTGNIAPKAEEILTAIKGTHPLLSKFLCTGYGVFLQNTDSRIAERILLTLLKQGIPSLTIHDSFIVRVDCRGILCEVMNKSFYDEFNFYPCIK